MPHLVLHLRGQRQLPAQRRRPHEPLALRQHPHQLAVRVHLDEPEHGRPVFVRHPVGGLHLASTRDVRLEHARTVRHAKVVVIEWEPAALLGCKDGIERERIGHRVASVRERTAMSA